MKRTCNLLSPSLFSSICCALVLSGTALSNAEAQTASIKGKIKGASGYTIALLAKDGSSTTHKLANNGRFVFKKIKRRSLKGSSLQLVGSDGRYFGPVVLGRKGRKVSISLSGKIDSKTKVLDLKAFKLKAGFAMASKPLAATLFSRPTIISDSSGKPRGAGNLGITSPSAQIHTQRFSIRAAASPGADSDGDGIVDTFDADDNGNGILDTADPASAGSDIPYVSLNFGFQDTLNANVRGGLSAPVIDAVVSGENIFNSTFFISLPPESTVDGGYLMCGDALIYCHPFTPLAYSSGVSESSDAFRGPLSPLLTPEGFPKLEPISVNGNRALVLSIQPRVGRDIFRAGDTYRIVLTSGTQEVSSRTFTLPPYFISIPALKDYTTNGQTTPLDYTASTLAGQSSSNPIVVGTDGLLTLNFWRPQREPVGDEVGYQDFGALNYGLIIDDAQATCAGLYSGVSSDLIEDSSALGTGGSPFAFQGANLNPLVDQQIDRSAAASNLLSFTVDLKSCLARADKAPGTYRVTLSAAGTPLTGGRNNANQVFYVTIP